MEAEATSRFGQSFLEEIFSIVEKEGGGEEGGRSEDRRIRSLHEAAAEEDSKEATGEEKEGPGEEGLSEEEGSGEDAALQKDARKKEKGLSKELALALFGGAVGTGAGAASHISRFMKQRKEWLSGRSNPPIHPKSTKLWDMLRKPDLVTPHMVRRIGGGAALGAVTGASLPALADRLRTLLGKKKRR
jgi:hypothetical protein